MDEDVKTNVVVTNSVKTGREVVMIRLAPTHPPRPQLDSMVHLHLGIDASGLPADLECHHLVVNDWANTTAHNNVCIASIPTGRGAGA
jgi:hypothetical protein